MINSFIHKTLPNIEINIQSEQFYEKSFVIPCK